MGVLWSEVRFAAEEDRVPNGHPLVMLSYSYWKSRFASDANIVSKPLLINSHSQLYGITRDDPMTIALAALALASRSRLHGRIHPGRPRQPLPAWP